MEGTTHYKEQDLNIIFSSVILSNTVNESSLTNITEEIKNYQPLELA